MGVKRLFTLLMAILLAVCLSGCIKSELKLTVHDDCSADIEQKVLVPKVKELQIDDNGRQELLQNKEYKKMVQAGYQVSVIQEDDAIGVVASKHVDQFDMISKDIIYTEQTPSGNQFAVNKVTRGNMDFYNLSGILNLSMSNMNDAVQQSQLDPKTQQMIEQFAKALLASAEFRLIVISPVAAGDHNAGKVMDNGKYLQWDFRMGEMNTFYANYQFKH